MRIGVRKSPHLAAVILGLEKLGVELTSTNDTGADFYLCWGWPQAEQVARDNGGGDRAQDIICVDSHPFALARGDKSGDRIFQLGNWGALARYPKLRAGGPVKVPKRKLEPDGPVLVLGHVSSTEQRRRGYIDVWHTPGGDEWIRDELEQPGRKFRPHPRMDPTHAATYTLEQDLEGCSRAVGWNTTAVVHARLLGYPAETIEPHGWGLLELEELAAQRVSPQALRSGEYWRHVYAPWLEVMGTHKRTLKVNER